MGARGDRAKALFEGGYNCAQAVLLAFSEETGLDEAVAASMAAPFGGGMGRLREVCGAVSASFMVLGCLYGTYPPGDHQGKATLYRRIQDLAGRFKADRGSIICREILGLPAGPDSPVPERRTGEYYARRPCGQLIADAADLLDQYLRENPPEKP